MNIIKKLKSVNYKSEKSIIVYIAIISILIASAIAVAVNIKNEKPANSNSIVADKDKDNKDKEKFDPKTFYKYIKGIKDLTIQKGTKVDYLQFVEFDKKFIKEIKADDSKIDINKVGEYDLLYKIKTKDDNEFGITVKVKVLDENKIQEEIKKGNEVVTDKGIENKKETVTLDKNENVTVSTGNNNKPSTGGSNNDNANNKPSTGGNNNNKPSKPDNGNSGNSGNNGNSKPTEPEKPQHTHDWKPQYQTINHPEQGHNEKVLVKEGWIEEVPIYETHIYTVCSTCGWVVASPDKPYNAQEAQAHALEHMQNGEPSGRHTEERQVQVGVDKIEHPPVYEDRWVVDKPAWTENKLIGYTCSCGATK